MGLLSTCATTVVGETLDGVVECGVSFMMKCHVVILLRVVGWGFEWRS